MAPFVETFAGIAKVGGEIAKEGAKKLAEAAKAAEKMIEDAAESAAPVEPDVAAGPVDLPDDFSSSPRDFSNLPDDFSRIDPDCSSLPDDFSLPETYVSDLPDDFSEMPNISQLPDDSGEMRYESELPDDSGKKMPECVEPTNKGNRSIEHLSLEEQQDVADKAAQDYNEKYKPVDRAIQKGYTDVSETPNGGVSFENSVALYKNGITQIEATGTRSGDFDAANAKLGLSETPTGYVWHHVDDYNVKTNTITMQLVRDDAHNASKPHSGGCAQYDAVHGPTYNPVRKDAI